MTRSVKGSLSVTAMLAGALIAAAAPADSSAATSTLADAPLVTIDLTTDSGVTAVSGTWRYSDAKIVETSFHSPDSDGQPTGAPLQTNDIVPHAGVAEFDDSQWQTVGATTLGARRGSGRVSFNWYRINITIPAKVGDFDPTGSTVWFETRLDDYAEVWVDGEIGRSYGQMGGSVVAGWNAANRLLVGRNVKPGQHIQLAVFGMNGPISDAPTNYIYVREAKLHFLPGGEAPVAVEPHEVNIHVERDDSRIDAIVPPNAKLYKIAEGFQFTEGPVWLRDKQALLFSDPNHNTIYQYSDGAPLKVYRDKSGYDAADFAEYGQPGSNGLTLDKQGRLTINEHGRHRVTRLERDGSLTVLAESFEGKRLNSPNDLLTRQVPGEEALDGMKMDVQGNLYLSAPGGIWIFDAKGTHLGTITAPKPVHNFAWGGQDGKTLYLCARSALYRVQLMIPGIRP